MEVVGNDSCAEEIAGTLSGQGELPFNITKDLSNLKVGLAELKDNPKLAGDQAFEIKMVDYLNNYADDFNADVKNGTLTADQQIALSDLNEDLKVNGLLSIMADGTLCNPNNQQQIGPFLSGLLSEDPKVDWVCIITKAIDTALGTPSK